jgi:hypothetical protein
MAEVDNLKRIVGALRNAFFLVVLTCKFSKKPYKFKFWLSDENLIDLTLRLLALDFSHGMRLPLHVNS